MSRLLFSIVEPSKVLISTTLTSWRLTVRAVTIATDVGAALAHTTTTKDLILRVVTPRFLTEGDVPRWTNDCPPASSFGNAVALQRV